MHKFDGRRTIILSAISTLFSLISLLIFLLLPFSEIANSIEYSSKIAIGILAASPLFAAVASAGFVCIFLKNRNNWSDFFPGEMLTASTVAVVLVEISNLVIYLKFFISQLSMGFVAPYTGTIYDNLAVVVTMFMIYKLIFTALVIVAVRRDKKTIN